MKKRKECLKCAIVLVSLIFFILGNSSFAFALEEKIIYEVSSNVTNSPEQPAPQWVIDKANDYIISVLGESYFEEHIKLTKNSTGKSRGYFFYYNYTHNVRDEPNGAPHQVMHLFQVQANWSGAIVGYNGPREPFQFLISSSEARDIAIQNGMKEPVVELDCGIQGYDSDTPISDGTCIWGVWTYEGVPKGNPDLFFIHVDTGEVLGKRLSEGEARTGVAAQTGENALESKNNEKIDIEPTQDIQINNSIPEDISNKKDVNENMITPKNEEVNIIQIIISWVKSLFVVVK
ncbi:hypothetical protein COV19_00125 [Candidatus Woesearchaeota archaeon CG10_big_fil_rev_8_21_14_0_10_44_13]|nr:MAG: hypothetical protein COV19_00125 [Candidatus Woesearchaeota archaeon CG10_big_fil_rev_8_21_14_0_10_44_13]